MWYTRSEDMEKRFGETKEVHIISSGMKAVSSWHMSNTLQTCREACGGMGFKSDSRIGVLKADTDTFLTYEGDNNILLQQVAKELLKEYKYGKKSGKFPQRLSYLNSMKQFCVNVPTDLNSPDFQSIAFKTREAVLLKKIEESISQSGMSTYDAWNEFCDLGAKCGKAYMERVILEDFMEDIDTCPDPKLKSILNLLRSLYALWIIINDNSFLALGVIPVEKYHILETETTKLIHQLKSHSLALVDSFGIPDHLLPPIAINYVAYNSWARALRDNEFHGKASL